MMTEAGAVDYLMALSGAHARDDLAMAVARADATAAIAGLDQALASHPLRQAFLY
jgi:hypothetical protein